MDLKKYSALAVSILFLKRESEAQVIYTDIPDTTLSCSECDLFIDLDNDGTFEVKLKKIKDSWSIVSNSSSWTKGSTINLYAIPKVNDAVLGNGGSYGGDVKALELFDPIGNSASWLADDKFRMGSWTGSIEYYGDGGNTDVFASGGYGPWYVANEDRYLGVRFNIGANTHYGWIKLYVKPKWMLVTLKDYAYQATPDVSIVAGEDFAVSSSIVEEDNWVVRSLPNKTIEIFLKSPEFIGGKITVVNVLGQPVATKNADQSLTRVMLPSSSVGLFAVSIVKGGKWLNTTVLSY